MEAEEIIADARERQRIELFVIIIVMLKKRARWLAPIIRIAL